MLRFIPRDPRPFDAAAASALRPYTGVLARLLHSRGVCTAEQAEAFLVPGSDQLHDPLLLNDMSTVLAILTHAKDEGWPTVVYGDYDVDGMCACTIMTQALRRFGLTVTPHVPLRAEGYGLNLPAMDALAKDFRLMVTVDLGITNAAEVRRAKELGMTVIVTDHHQLGLEPCPADAVVNPLMNDYPFGRLCGTGVAYKVACALFGADAAREWLDLAALATVADIVPLLDENRVLVAHGLPRMGDRLGVKALMDVAAVKQPLNAGNVGFQLAPRLNAAGRLGDANDGVRLLLTDDPDEAAALALKLDDLNTERKRIEQTITEQALLQAQTHDFVHNRVLFVRGEGWNAGVIGLVAGRLNHRYSLPVCAMSEENGVLHGSLRGVRGVHLANCLKRCDDLLERYGGHEMAAGVTLKAENDAAFRERLEAAVRASASPDAFVPAQEIDQTVSLTDLTDELLNALEQMEPFGCENPAPVFLTEGAHLDRRRAVGREGAHLQLTLRQGDALLGGIAFGMGAQADTLPDIADVAYEVAREEYMGRTSVKCRVKALRPGASALADALQAESDTPWQNALLRALRDLQKAGNSSLHAEKNTNEGTLCLSADAVPTHGGGDGAGAVSTDSTATADETADSGASEAAANVAESASVVSAEAAEITTADSTAPSATAADNSASVANANVAESASTADVSASEATVDSTATADEAVDNSASEVTASVAESTQSADASASEATADSTATADEAVDNSASEVTANVAESTQSADASASEATADSAATADEAVDNSASEATANVAESTQSADASASASTADVSASVATADETADNSASEASANVAESASTANVAESASTADVSATADEAVDNSASEATANVAESAQSADASASASTANVAESASTADVSASEAAANVADSTATAAVAPKSAKAAKPRTSKKPAADAPAAPEAKPKRVQKPAASADAPSDSASEPAPKPAKKPRAKTQAAAVGRAVTLVCSAASVAASAAAASPVHARLPMDALLAGCQGTLFVAYTRTTALRFLRKFGDRVELCRRVASDPRCFHTLLVQPDLSMVSGDWQTVVLLDGMLAPNEPLLWRARLPQAELIAAPRSRALRDAAVAIDAGDDAYRALYRLLRKNAFSSLHEIAARFAEAQTAAHAKPEALGEAQLLAGLVAFDSLGLISLGESPFSIVISSANRCSLDDSPILSALRRLGKEEQGC